MRINETGCDLNDKRITYVWRIADSGEISNSPHTGMKDPSILFFTVAKQVDIDIVAAGHVVWTRPAN